MVAALTVPSLIQNHKKHVIETKLKHVYSIMNQAITMSEIDNGVISDWSGYKKCQSYVGQVICPIDETIVIFDKYIGKYIKYTKIEKMSSNQFFNVYFNNGSILNVHGGLSDSSFYIDSAAFKHPYKGKNEFNFNILLYNKGFEPYRGGWDNTREGLFNTSIGYGCGERYNNLCTKLIQYSGWKIPDDYPIKF